MAIALETYAINKNFPNTEPVVTIINIPIQIGIGTIAPEPELQYPEINRINKQTLIATTTTAKIEGLWKKIQELKLKQKPYPKPNFEPYIPDSFGNLEQELLYPETVRRKVLELHKKSTAELWEKRVSKKFWSRNLDGNSYQFKNIDADGDEYIETCGHFVERAHVHERNNDIFKRRCKYLREYKTGKGNYENLGNYYYKSDEAYRQFLEEVEQKGLVKKAEPKKCTVEIKALDPISQKDIVEPNNYFYNEETGDYEILREDEL